MVVLAAEISYRSDELRRPAEASHGPDLRILLDHYRRDVTEERTILLLSFNAEMPDLRRRLHIAKLHLPFDPRPSVSPRALQPETLRVHRIPHSEIIETSQLLLSAGGEHSSVQVSGRVSRFVAGRGALPYSAPLDILLSH